MKRVKQFLTFLLIIVLCVGSVETVTATDTSQTNEISENATISGNGSIGGMVADEINTQSQEETSGNNYISELELSGNVAEVQFGTEKAANLVVAIYDDLDCVQMLASGKTTVTTDAIKATVTVETQDMPQYFVARAFLVEKDSFKPLCEPYTTQLYTKTLQDFKNSTVDDYKDREVLQLDENNKQTNFGVYKDNTLLLDENTPGDQITDHGNGTYTITAADKEILSLKTGDTFSYEYQDGSVLLVKIADILVDGDTVFIREDTNTDITDYFDYFKLEVDNSNIDNFTVDDSDLPDGITLKPDSEESMFSLNDNVESEETPAVGWPDIDKKYEKSSTVELKDFTEYENHKIDGEIKLSFSSSIKLYTVGDYKYFSLKNEVFARFSMQISGKYASPDIPLPKMSFSYLKILNLEIQPCFYLSAAAKIACYHEITFTFGVEYDSDLGGRSLEAKWDHDGKLADVSGNISVGLKIPLKAYAIHEKLGKATVTADLSLIASAENDAIYGYGKDVIHDCVGCFKGTISAKLGINCKVDLFEDTKINITPLSITHKLMDFYWSVGHEEFGLNTCPYIYYPAEIKVQNEKKQPLKNVVLTVTEKETGKIVKLHTKIKTEDYVLTDKNGEAKFYLPNGSYIVHAEKDNETNTSSMTILNKNGGAKLVLKNLLPELTPTETPEPTPTEIPEPTSMPMVTPTPTVSPVPSDQDVDSSGTDQNISWKLMKDGTFYINGTGDMPDYYAEISGSTIKNDTTPWSAWGGKNKIKHVIIGEGITRIGNNTFSGCTSLHEIEYPASLKVIGARAFYSCTGLGMYSKFNFPENLEKIEKGAFCWCDASSELVFPESLKVIESDSFTQWGNLSKVVLPDGLKEIEARTFDYCYSLKEVIIPASVTKIGDCAFLGCYDLANITLPQNLKEIGWRAFYMCYDLKEVTIPSEVTKIATEAFDDNVRSIYFKGNKPELSKDFIAESSDSSINIYYPKGNITWENIEDENLTDNDINWIPYDFSEKNSNDESQSTQSVNEESLNGHNSVADTFADDEAENNSPENEQSEEQDLNLTDEDSEVIIETLEPFVVNAWESTDSSLTSSAYSDRKPGSYSLFVVVKNKNVNDILNPGNLLYINQRTADGNGFVSFTYKLPQNSGNSIPCIFGDSIHKHQHSYGKWVTVKKATVFAPEVRQRKCSGCGKTEKQNFGQKLKPVLKLSASTVTLQVKQSTKGLRITKMEVGDSVVSWKSANTKIVKVSKTGKLTAQKKTGKTTVTVKLKSGITKKITVKIQKNPVKTTKITGLKNKMTVKRGKKYSLKPVLQPFTSLEKVTYKSSNRKIVTVTSRGTLKGLKRGKARITVKSGKKKYIINMRIIVFYIIKI